MTNVVTLRVDDVAQARFEAMRQAHFPAYLNRIPAHLTLFHSLPDREEVNGVLRAVAGAKKGFRVRVTGLRSLGRGVAYVVGSGELLQLHQELSDALGEHLIAQDRQRFKPHVVIQNKSTPEAARTLLARLEEEFAPFEAVATGVDVWHYLGGPWGFAEGMPFQAAQ